MKIKLEQKHYQWGLTAFLVIICSVIAFFIVFRLELVGKHFGMIINVLAPFIYGLVMAYLICPIYNFSVSRSYALMNKGKYKFKYDLTFSKVIGTIVAVAVLVIVIAGVLWMIIPGLIENIVKVVEMLPYGLEKFTAWIDVKFANIPLAKETIDDWSRNATDYLINYATETILPHTGSLAASISGTLIGALGAMFDFIIGVIICVYFLNIKDTLAAQAKKLIVANFKESRAEAILEGADYTNRTFGGFISGKIIDSAIIGIMCFIIMSIFSWEYSLLISCIIGITNIIPFFGPFIGGIPSALLLLMVDPRHCLYFVIMIVLLQQFDGNILGPKILGDSTGLASFWVLFAVIVGGGLFGFVGMILGIPVFAVIYAYCSRAINRRLQRKGFSTSTLDYKVDQYRIRRPKKKKKPNLDDPGEEINLDAYVTEEVTEITEEEIRMAEEAGHTIMEATLVQYKETEETFRDEADKDRD
ncbi:MAG: AI-2E family transporter [Bacillota bacterium]|nr:AI-2E family transporter [Bacillota bacterium]